MKLSNHEDICIRTLIFDFDQTLIDSSNGFQKAEESTKKKIFQILNENGSDFTDFNEFNQLYENIRQYYVYKEFNHDRKIWWNSIFQNTGIFFDDFQGLEDEYWDIVEKKSVLFPETIETLKILSESNKIGKMGLISNTDGQIGRKLHRINKFSQLKNYFSSIIVAGEDGITPKPNKESFKICMKKLGIIDTKNVYYVGDDYTSDIIGANYAQLSSILINRTSKTIENNKDIIYKEIKSLHELLHFLNVE